MDRLLSRSTKRLQRAMIAGKACLAKVHLRIQSRGGGGEPPR